MFEQAFRAIDDVLRKEAGCTTELDYTEQTSWLLFLKYLDGLEQDKATEAQLEGKRYAFILDKAYRWEEWAAPKGADAKIVGTMRAKDIGIGRRVSLQLFWVGRNERLQQEGHARQYAGRSSVARQRR